MREENAFSSTDVSINVKTQEAGKSASCVETRPKILKALTRRLLWLTWL